MILRRYPVQVHFFAFGIANHIFPWPVGLEFMYELQCLPKLLAGSYENRFSLLQSRKNAVHGTGTSPESEYRYAIDVTVMEIIV